MKIVHSRGSVKLPSVWDKPLRDCTEGYACVYVNQDINSPILWRFSACPIPSFLQRYGKEMQHQSLSPPPSSRIFSTSSEVTVGALFPQLVRSWLMTAAISASDSSDLWAGIATA